MAPSTARRRAAGARAVCWLVCVFALAPAMAACPPPAPPGRLGGRRGGGSPAPGAKELVTAAAGCLAICSLLCCLGCGPGARLLRIAHPEYQSAVSPGPGAGAGEGGAHQAGDAATDVSGARRAAADDFARI